MRKKSPAFITSGLLILCPLVSFAAIPEKPVLPKSPNTRSSETTGITQKTAPDLQATDRESFQSFTGKIVANRVRLRTQPHLEGHVVKELSPGELHAVVGEDNDYYTVQAPRGMKGYVFRTFVLEDVVEGARVNVRLQPDTDSPIIALLNSGEKVKSTISPQNNKWLEIDLPQHARFYIAKEYVEKIGGLDLIQKQEQRKAEATQILNSALLFGQSELRKPFEEIDFNSITKNFEKLNAFTDIREISEKAKESQALIQETYIQKKIAFLESKADRATASTDRETAQQRLLLEKNYQDSLSKIDDQLKNGEDSSSTKKLATFAGQTVEATGQSAASHSHSQVAEGPDTINDKMLVWEPLEQSIYQIWAASNENKNLNDFYEEEQMNATVLSGIVEPYVRPVKNRPGDFILRIDNLPVAFLYSTKVNLQDKIGKKVTVTATPRPNNNFAFPAYYVISVE